MRTSQEFGFLSGKAPMTSDQHKSFLSALEQALTVAPKALESYGTDAQRTIALEEMGELITALAREERGRAGKAEVLEEIADVLITAIQLALIYGADETAAQILYKIKRLGKTLPNFDPPSENTVTVGDLIGLRRME